MDADQKRKVVKALENDQFEWRTLQGLAKETGLATSDVNSILHELGEQVVRTLKKDGEPLFTTREHYTKTATPTRRFFSALSGSLK